ncbi:hypothetical protein, partial [Amycolatopsis japonica]
RVGTLAYARDGSVQIKARDNGEGWIRKHPRGKKDEQGTYTLTAPAQAPRLGLTKPIRLGPGNGESSLTAAAPAALTSDPGAPTEVVEWRPAKDGSGPRNLPEYVRWRGIAHWLSGEELKKAQLAEAFDFLLARTSLGRLSPELAQMVWDYADLEPTSEGTRILLGETRLAERLPLELQLMIRDEVAQDPHPLPEGWAEAWLKKIIFELGPDGRFLYPAEEVARLSGGSVDSWLVRDLRGVSRADWHGRLSVDGTLSIDDSMSPFDRGVVVSMLEGFVNAAIQAPPGELPSVHGVIYSAEGTPGLEAYVMSMLVAQAVWHLHSRHRLHADGLSDEKLRARLNQYLVTRVDIRQRELPNGDERVGTAHIHVDKQQPPGGLYGLVVYETAEDPNWTWAEELEDAHVVLAGVRPEDAVFTRAREVVNRYNQEPWQYTGQDSVLQRLHQRRYDAAVKIVAAELHQLADDPEEAESAADHMASEMADDVGPRRRHGVVGAGTSQNARSGSAVKPGWLVPVDAGIGVVQAGMVLGDLGSKVGLAGRWLQREPGVFGVVFTDQNVPDVETVVRALRAAGWNGRDAVRLFLCAQPGLRKFVGILGDRVRVRVSYVPRYQLWLGMVPDGRAVRPAAGVGIGYVNGRPRLTLLDDGKGWRDRETTGEEKPGKYVLPPPVQAPRLGLDQAIHLGPRAGSSPVSQEVAEWRPDEEAVKWWLPAGVSNQRTLKAFLLGRGLARWLRDGKLGGVVLSDDVADLLNEWPLSVLPPELLDMVLREVALDPASVPQVKAWLDKIKFEPGPYGGYHYSPDRIADLSGDLVDAWTVLELRLARAQWQGRLDYEGMLAGVVDQVVTLMLWGFVDAAVRAPSGELPSVRWVFYVAEEDPDPGSAAARVVAAEVEYRLGQYPSGVAEVSAKTLAGQVRIETVDVPAGSSLIGTTRFDVYGQRPPGGLYGPEVHRKADEVWMHATLAEMRAELAGLDSEEVDAVFEKARGVVNRYNLAPEEITGPASLRALHEDRYEAMIAMIAEALPRFTDDPEGLEELADLLADRVGLRRRRGVVGVGPVPVVGQGDGLVRLGEMVPVAAGVGRIRAGAVLGDLGSKVGLASRWLRREPGVFGVVITDHDVPDVETVLAALEAAGWNGKDAVRLFLCAQPGLREFVGILGDRVQVRVSYVPKFELWLGMPVDRQTIHPAARVGTVQHDINGRPELTLLDDGKGWIDREKTGEENPGTYTQWAPAQAPRLRLDEPIHLGPRTGYSPVSQEVAEWRRPVDKSEPQTLKAFLVHRGIANWLGAEKLRGTSGEVKRLLDGTALRKVKPELRQMIWDRVTPPDPLNKEARFFLEETRLGKRLPLELLELIRDQVALDPVSEADVKTWFAGIKDQVMYGEYLYSSREVAEMSGELADRWVVEQLRGIARADWNGRLIDSGWLSHFGSGVFAWMLRGFVDAAVGAEARGGVLPSVQGVLYVAQRDVGEWKAEVRSFAEQTMETWLAKYPPESVSVSVRSLLARVDIRTRVLRPRDSRIGTAWVHVEGQRSPGGLYDLFAHEDGIDSSVEALLQAGLTRDDEVFRRAREVVNRYNEEPSRFAGEAPWLQQLYQARYENQVAWVALVLHHVALVLHQNADDVDKGERLADQMASKDAHLVGPRRRHGVLGGEPEPVSGPGSVAEPGWLVPAGDGVGIVEAGMVFGDVGSPVGLAGRWLRHEPGVFGVVFTGHIAPDVETVVKALHAAGWNGKDSLRLFLGLPVLAGQLGERFKVVVSYPEAEVWFGMARDHAAGRPAVRVRKIENADDLKRPSLLKNGMGWIDREPGGAEKPGTYVLTASVEAPRLGLDRIIHLGPRTDTVPVAEDVAGWRPAQDGTGPRDLKKFLLHRGLARWLKDGKLAGVVLSDDAAKLFDGPLLGRLPVELWETVLQQVALDPTAVPQVEAWFERIKEKIDPENGLPYPAKKVAEMSGELVDEWVARESKWEARADWHGRLIEDRERWRFDEREQPIEESTLTNVGTKVISAMLDGFVDAAVEAWAQDAALPSVRGVLYLEEGDLGAGFLAALRSLTERVLEYRLTEYPAGVAPRKLAEELLARVGFWIRMVPPGDPRIDTARLHVDGQRALGGLYGPDAYRGADSPRWRQDLFELQEARTGLAALDREEADAVREWAGKLVNGYNEKPVEFTGRAPRVHRLHRARYEAAVELVAWKLHNRPEGGHGSRGEFAEKRASELADWVGLRKRRGVVGDVSARYAGPRSGSDSGGLVPVSARVGIVQAGVVLGDLYSPAGRAARWLSPESGVFGVVIADHRVPDVETVVKALHDAGWNGKDALRLFLCAQPGLAELAEQLEARFNVRVSYPRSQVWFGMPVGRRGVRAAARVGTIEIVDGYPRPRLMKHGEGWIDREPGGEKKEGRYVLPAPARAPRLGLEQMVHLGPRTGSSPVSEKVAKWRRPERRSKPQTLRDFVEKRGIVDKLRPSRLAKGRPRKDTKLLFNETPLGKLPLELLELIREQVEADPISPADVEAWFAGIKDEMGPDGEYLYSAHEVEVMSGGLADERVVEQLRGVARADWHGRLIDLGWMTYSRVLDDMVRGFVDAAVGAEARGGVLPSVQGVLYVEQGDDTSADEVSSFVERQVKTHLARYPRDSAAVRSLLARVDIRTRELPPRDARIGTAWVHVERQRPPGGLYGPVAHWGVVRPSLESRLRQARLTRGDAVFRRARELVNRYNEEPSRFAGEDPRLQQLYRARYEYQVGWVAVVLHENSHNVVEAERLADHAAFTGAASVGPYRRHGVLGGETVPVSGLGSGVEPGWLVPAGDGVGVVEAGLVLGDANSKPGLAGRWLQHEPGVFGVVVTGHWVPDVETVVRALEAAGWNKKDKVRLFLSYQLGLWERVEELSDRLGVVVFFSTEKLLLGMAGGVGRPAARVEKIEYVDGKPQLTLLDDGTGWSGRKPGGGEETEGAAYVLAAPEQAPRLGLDQVINLGPWPGFSPVSREVAGWRRPADVSEPQTLKAFLVHRGIANWLSTERLRGTSSEVKRLLDGTALRKLDPELRQMIWDRVTPPDPVNKKARFFLEETRLGKRLPLELLEMIRDQVALDPASQADVEAWFAGIKDQLGPDGGYLYPNGVLAAMSGGLADEWVVEQLRGVARADWHGRLIDSGWLSFFGSDVFAWMLRGFVDAAVGAEARGWVLPSVQGVLYIEQGDDTSAGKVRSYADDIMETRLSDYPPMSAAVRSLPARVDIRTRELPPGDARIGTAWVHVEGQRRPGGFDTPVAHDEVSDPSVEERLRQAGVSRGDAVFRRAREVVNRYNEEPSRFADEDPRLQQMHQARYENQVDWVALVLHENSHDVVEAERLADQVASTGAGFVGPLRRHGVLGGGSVSGVGVRSGSGVEPGWLVPAGDGVGVVEAGLVLGDANSKPGLAGRWLQREPGVFGVVVTGHRVPDVETVVRALEAAGWNKKDKVRLFLCYQPGLEQRVEELADGLGVVVFFSTEKLWFGMAGGAGRPAARVEKIEYVDGKPRLTLLDDGTGWSGRKPGGGEETEGAAYVLTAPERAPRLGLTQEIHLGPQTNSSSTVDISSGPSRADIKPFVPAGLKIPAVLVGWRPAKDGTGPQTLRDYLREFLLLRLSIPWLRDAKPDMTLVNEGDRLLSGTHLGDLPREVQYMVWKEVELDLIEAIQAWADDIKDEISTDDGGYHYHYRYTETDVMVLSGGLVDSRIVDALRREARVNWQGRLTHSGVASADEHDFLISMLRGFVDAAVQAPPGALPSVRGVVYATDTDATRLFGIQYLAVAEMVDSRLEGYRSQAVSVSVPAAALMARVDIRTRVLPHGDPRVGVARLRVEGQRLPGGVYGPRAYKTFADSPFSAEVQSARVELVNVDREGTDFTRARAIVHRYNPDPSKFTGPASPLRRWYESRYEDTVLVVTEILRRLADDPDEAERAADEKANHMSFHVGLRQPEGVLGRGWEQVSERGSVRGASGSLMEPGWLVPVSDHVGIIEAGMVLGDANSKPGLAARWLPHEPGVFGVVITDHRVPDMETVVNALHEAGWNEKDAVRFFVCSLPRLPKLAARLETRYGVRVSHPEEQQLLVFGMAGEAGRPAARVAKLVVSGDGRQQVKLLDDGTGWIDREPGGVTKRGTYLLTAPAQAPSLGLTEPISLGPQAPAAVPAKPLVPGRLVGWRPEKDESGRTVGPRTLRAYLREYPLLRAVVPWLSDGERDMAQLKGEAESVLFRTRVGNLPRELLDMVWKEMERDLLESVEAWFVHILNELDPPGVGYRYSPAAVEEMSGGLVDAWVVEQLRGFARASWQMRLNNDGTLSPFDRGVITEMLAGFVDATAWAEPEAWPSVRVVQYVANGAPGNWAGLMRLRARQMMQDRLEEYLSDEAEVAATLKKMLAKVGVQVIGVPVGDARIGTVHVDVDGQRPPGGLYGPETWDVVDDPAWNPHYQLAAARQSLARAGVDRGDAVFTQARALLDKYSEEPTRFRATELQRLHEARYEAAVEILAWAFHDNSRAELSYFEFLASDLADSVGLRRRLGVVGGESVPGGLVPVGVGVGRVRAGVVVGRLGSPVGRAARWLRREPGAFAVVVPGHGVPDA